MDELNPDKLLEGHFYRLDGKKAVPCSFEEYAESIKSPKNRIVEQTQIGEILVSTVFTGIDRAFGTGEKQLFETTVFGLNTEFQPVWRHGSYNSAVKSHRDTVSRIKDDMDSLIREINGQ